MRYWVFVITDYVDRPELASGWIRAADLDAARGLVPHAGVNLYEVPDDSGFPPHATGPITWEHRVAALMN